MGTNVIAVKEEGFTPYGQSRDFYLGRVIYCPFTWFGVRWWGMRTPLISDCGQRCEVTAWGGWNFVVKQRLAKGKKTAIFQMQNFDLMRNNVRKLQRLLIFRSANFTCSSKKRIQLINFKIYIYMICVWVFLFFDFFFFVYCEKIIYAYMQRHIFIKASWYMCN